MANVKDAATGTVLTAPSPATSGTSLTLNSGEGARFPTPPFYAVAHANNTMPTASTAEKILVTGVSTDTFTIVRTQGSTFTNQSIAVTWRISNAIFADDLNNASIIKNETPGGSINGSNAAFTIASAAKITGTLEVYKNGIRMKGGGADYTESAGGFTMVTAPATSTVLLCDYIVGGALTNVGTNSLITDEVPAGTINGSTTLFTLARAYIAGSVEVYLNGIKQLRGTDFTETTPASGTFTMSAAPLTADILTANYQFNLNPSSNSDTVDGYHGDDLMPVASLLPYASDTLPSSNWLFCFGQSVLRTDYAVLFTRIGTTYGSADGTHFNLPDLRGRAIAGQDDMGGTSANRLTGVTGSVDGDVLGGTGGEEAHTLSGAESGTSVHGHGITDPGHGHVYNAVNSASGNNGSQYPWLSDITNRAPSTLTSTTGVTINNSSAANASNAHNNVQPTIILNYIIKAL